MPNTIYGTRDFGKADCLFRNSIGDNIAQSFIAYNHISVQMFKQSEKFHFVLDFFAISLFLFCFIFRCFVDCGAVVSASNKLRVTSECSNSACNGSVYEWRLQQHNEQNNTWKNVPILPNMTSTAVNATNMIIMKNSLPSGFKFSLKLVVTSQARSEGFGVVEFETAGAPHSGYCTSSASEGVALETKFTFECFNWEDKNTPITYDFRAEKDSISSGTSPKSASAALSAGKPEDDYQLQINIIIKNSVGVAIVETLFVKVNGLLPYSTRHLGEGL